MVGPVTTTEPTSVVRDCAMVELNQEFIATIIEIAHTTFISNPATNTEATWSVLCRAMG